MKYVSRDSKFMSPLSSHTIERKLRHTAASSPVQVEDSRDWKVMRFPPQLLWSPTGRSAQHTHQLSSDSIFMTLIQMLHFLLGNEFSFIQQQQHRTMLPHCCDCIFGRQAGLFHLRPCLKRHSGRENSSKKSLELRKSFFNFIKMFFFTEYRNTLGDQPNRHQPSLSNTHEKTLTNLCCYKCIKSYIHTVRMTPT